MEPSIALKKFAADYSAADQQRTILMNQRQARDPADISLQGILVHQNQPNQISFCKNKQATGESKISYDTYQYSLVVCTNGITLD